MVSEELADFRLREKVPKSPGIEPVNRIFSPLLAVETQFKVALLAPATATIGQSSVARKAKSLIALVMVFLGLTPELRGQTSVRWLFPLNE